MRLNLDRTRCGRALTGVALLVSTLAVADGVSGPVAAVAPTTDGKPSATLRWYGDASSATGNALGNGECDVNGDGFDDVVVGAWFWDKAPLNNIGAAYVLFGGEALAAGDLNDPAAAGAVRIDGPAQAGESVGFAVACTGDLNGDGFDDVAVSHYSAQKVYVVFGAADFTTLTVDSLGDRGFVIAGDATSGNVGFSMAPVGDIDDDGLSDFAVAEVVADTRGRTNNGRVWIIAGRDDIADVDLIDRDPERILLTIDGATEGERLGQIADVGDVNGDGIDDILLGSYSAIPWGPAVAVPGAAYVVWGGSNVDLDLAAIGTRGFAIFGPTRQRDRLGMSVSGLGDVDGDGLADLLVGADGVSNGATGPRSGGAAVVFGSASPRTVYTDPASSTNTVYTCAGAQTAGVCATPTDSSARGYWINGAVASDATGYSVAGIGDINGDAIGDLAVGAYGYDPINPVNPAATMSGAGALWVVFGKSTTDAQALASITPTEGYRIDGLAAGDRFGRQVALVGDMDGNGINDVAAAGDFAARPLAPGTPRTQSGEVIVALLGPLSTSVTITPSTTTANTGGTVTLTAHVSSDIGGGAIDGGTVAFTLDEVPLDGCAAVAVDTATGVATCEKSLVAHGAIAAVATYSGTAQRASAVSAAVTITVHDTTTTSLTMPDVDIAAGSLSTITAHVDAVGSSALVDEGTVTFTADSVPISGCAGVTVAGGAVACTTTFAAAASVGIAAAYSGGPHLGASASDPRTLTVVAAPISTIAPPAVEGASAYVSFAPCRLADTREAGGYTRVDASTITVLAAGRCNVPLNATAVAVTLTIDGATSDGFLTAWPHGEVRPSTSNLNYDSGQIRANGAVIALGDGALSVYNQRDARGVIVDVTGAFVPSGPTAAGRFVPLEPNRLLDTRLTSIVPTAGQVAVALPSTLPPDATAVAVNVTVTETTKAGFVTAWPAGQIRPTASTLNMDGPGQTRAAGAVLPVSSDGLLLFASTSTHVVVDITGYFTGASAPVSDGGLFVATTPQRLLDTRTSTRLAAPTAMRVPSPKASALAANITIVDPATPGWVIAYPSGATRPATSSVNASAAGEIAASLALVALSPDLSVYSQTDTDALVDQTGYFTLPTAIPITEPATTPATTTTVAPTSTTTTTTTTPPVQSQPALSESYVNRNWTPTVYDTCPAALHASFATLGPDAKLYPTWHPAEVIDPATGSLCTFGHEHGDDPATSDIYDWAVSVFTPPAGSPTGGTTGQGIPFGLANEALDIASDHGTTQAARHEDNVGHKISVANNVKLIAKSPRGYVRFTNSAGDNVPVECDYLIKVHQGSHSADATTNNAHELFYAMRCNDGTEVAVTTLSRFGNPNQYNRSCQPAAVVTTSGSNLPAGSGGQRLIPDRGCVDQYVLVSPTVTTAYSDIWSMYEVWQSANQITRSDGTVLAAFDPWFAVRNPSRFGWTAKNSDGTDGIGYTVDAAWETDTADNGRVNAQPWLALCTLPAVPPRSPESPFDGAQRDFYLGGTTVTNNAGSTIWYTDPYGANASTTPFAGSIRQFVSATADRGYPVLERRNFGLSTDYGTTNGNDNGVHAPN